MWFKLNQNINSPFFIITIIIIIIILLSYNHHTIIIITTTVCQMKSPTQPKMKCFGRLDTWVQGMLNYICREERY